VAENLDAVQLYAAAQGYEVRRRTVVVEGTTDVDLFCLAARLERQASGVDLLGDDLAFAAAGLGDRGGTPGVIRELIRLQGFTDICLGPNGKPKYRFIALFDNDKAGRQAVGAARNIDTSILEYKDVFRLSPIMPLPGNLDPTAVRKAFERENESFKGLDWEAEDLISHDFYEAFLAENPGALIRAAPMNGKIHRELTRDGKARLHQFVRHNAMLDDLTAVIELLKALRYYLGLKSVDVVKV
jgi:hypothetical protein